MAMVVPVSHTQRWRSRSRNPSTDFDQCFTSSSSAFEDSGSEHDDAQSWAEEPEDDEDQLFDDMQASPWLVMPQGFVSQLDRRVPKMSCASPSHQQQQAFAPPALLRLSSNPSSDHALKKAMEMRRARQLQMH